MRRFDQLAFVTCQLLTFRGNQRGFFGIPSIRVAKLAACPHQQIFSTFYPRNVYIVFFCDKNAVSQGFFLAKQLLIAFLQQKCITIQNYKDWGLGIQEQGVKQKKLKNWREKNPHQLLPSWPQFVQQCCPSSVQLNYWNPANLYFSPRSYKF